MNTANILLLTDFDKPNNICRNTKCEKSIKPPFKKYCSNKCSERFEKWYYNNFNWDNTRTQIFKRDNFTCQNCKKKYPYKLSLSYPFIYKKNIIVSSYLECHHIIPRSLYKDLGYSLDSKDNKIKAITEFLHNYKNLKTLCKKCHKTITKEYIRDKTTIHYMLSKEVYKN